MCKVMLWSHDVPVQMVCIQCQQHAYHREGLAHLHDEAHVALHVLVWCGAIECDVPILPHHAAVMRTRIRAQRAQVTS